MSTQCNPSADIVFKLRRTAGLRHPNFINEKPSFSFSKTYFLSLMKFYLVRFPLRKNTLRGENGGIERSKGFGTSAGGVGTGHLSTLKKKRGGPLFLVCCIFSEERNIFFQKLVLPRVNIKAIVHKRLQLPPNPQNHFFSSSSSLRREFFPFFFNKRRNVAPRAPSTSVKFFVLSPLNRIIKTFSKTKKLLGVKIRASRR